MNETQAIKRCIMYKDPSGFEFLVNGEEALIPKISLVAIVLGFLFLFIYILRERLRVYKVDKYKEVKR